MICNTHSEQNPIKSRQQSGTRMAGKRTTRRQQRQHPSAKQILKIEKMNLQKQTKILSTLRQYNK